MKVLSREELRKLTEKPGGWCVSIYMPTHRASPETKQDPIRLKNLIREAEERLMATGVRSPEIKKFLKPAKALIKDGLFWQYQADGLVLFISSGLFYHYRLPLQFDELVVVTERFHIKPLLPVFSQENRFYILALSQNETRLFQCNRYSVTELKLENVPRSLSEALKYDEPEKQLQFHTRAPSTGGERAAMFHGHGVGKEDAKDNLLRFFQQLDQGLTALLGNQDAPLVLAGVDYLFPIYKEASHYPRLMENGIVGNPEALSGEELHEQAWRIMEPYFHRTQEEAFSKYRQFEGNGKVSNNANEIVPAAYDGRIDTLFVGLGVQQWGTFDPEEHTATFHSEPKPGDEDLLDFAAVHTYLNGGTVYPLKPEEMPDQTPLAALFRY